MSPKIALVAALDREIRPLVRGWTRSERKFEGRTFKFFESDRAVLVCGGIGAEAARRAAEAAIALYSPTEVCSVGFAGALNLDLKVGQVLVPSFVIDAKDGSRTDARGSDGTLISFAAVAGREQKAKLANAYQAQAIDMEAAAVAKGTEPHHLRFSAVKVISDDSDFKMDFAQRFITQDGSFRTGGLVLYAAIRPWLWARMFHLGRNSSLASHKLCEWLQAHLGNGAHEGLAMIGRERSA